MNNKKLLEILTQLIDRIAELEKKQTLLYAAIEDMLKKDL